MYDYLSIYEENQLREQERLLKDEELSQNLEGIGLLGGSPQW